MMEVRMNYNKKWVDGLILIIYLLKIHIESVSSEISVLFKVRFKNLSALY